MTKPTLKETVDAWAVLERAGIFPLMSICVADIMFAHGDKISEEDAFKIAKKIEHDWEDSDAWTCMMDEVADLVKEKTDAAP